MTFSANDMLVGPVTPAEGVTVINVDFYFEAAAHLSVYKSGSDTALVLTTDYTVTLPTEVDATDGYITLTTAADGSDAYSIFCSQPIERTSDLQFRGDFRSKPINLELDRLWRAMSKISTDLSRALTLSKVSTVPGSLDTPSAAGRASKLVGFDSNGDLALVSGGVDTSLVSAFMEDFIIAASAADGLTVLGITASVAELNYMDGVTSAVQTQLDAKLPLAGGTMTGNQIFGDGVSALFGTDSDATIQHNGTNFFIANGTGAAYFRSDTIYFQNAAGDETLASFTANGAATLYYDNSAVLDTNSSGINVTGMITVNDLALFGEVISYQTAASSTYLDFTGFDSSKYAGYMFLLANVRPATDSVILYLRTSTNGGSTFATSGYYYAAAGRSTSGAAVTMNSLSGAGIALADDIGNNTNEHGVSGQVVVMRPDSTSRRTLFKFETTFLDYLGNLGSYGGGGTDAVTQDVDAVRFLFSSGAIESGTIMMIGIRLG